MERRIKVFWGSLIFILFVATLIVAFNQKKVRIKEKFNADADKAIQLAKMLYRRDTAQGVDMSQGPCLTNDLMPGWVADIVHNPRTPVDDQPSNQCPAYSEGRAWHFVELDTNGNLVRVE